MGLLLSPNITQIKLLGAPIDLNQIYVRIEYYAHSDGKTISIKFQTYYNKTNYINNEVLVTDIPYNGFSIEILPTEIQSLDTALNYSITKFGEWGYSASLE